MCPFSCFSSISFWEYSLVSSQYSKGSSSVWSIYHDLTGAGLCPGLNRGMQVLITSQLTEII